MSRTSESALNRSTAAVARNAFSEMCARQLAMQRAQAALKRAKEQLIISREAENKARLDVETAETAMEEVCCMRACPELQEAGAPACMQIIVSCSCHEAALAACLSHFSMSRCVWCAIAGRETSEHSAGSECQTAFRVP